MQLLKNCLLAVLVFSLPVAGCDFQDEHGERNTSPSQAVDDDSSDDATGADDDETSPDPWLYLVPSGLPVNKIMGMATQMNDNPDPRWDRDFEIEKLLEAGLYRLRASVDWGDVEPSQDDWHFEKTDPFVNLIAESGLQFDGRLCYGVDWARPDGFDSELAPEDFADFAGKVAEHYCDVIKSYEIWNEENLWIFWKPEPDPDHYGKILKASYTAIKEACPDAKVVFGGLSCFQLATATHGLYYYLEQIHRAHPDIADFFDVLAIHPYTFAQTTSPEWEGIVDGFRWWPSMPGQIRVARQRLADIGAEGKPIWLTEWGWPSLIIGKQAQAHWFARGALLSIAEGVEALDWYTFWDREGGSFPPTEDYFGLFAWAAGENDTEAKPAFQTAVALSAALGASRYAGDLSSTLGFPKDVYGLAFVEEDSDAIIFTGWDARGLSTKDIRLPCPRDVTYYRISTEAGRTLSEGVWCESLPIRLSDEVTYVRFDRQ